MQFDKYINQAKVGDIIEQMNVYMRVDVVHKPQIRNASYGELHCSLVHYQNGEWVDYSPPNNNVRVRSGEVGIIQESSNKTETIAVQYKRPEELKNEVNKNNNMKVTNLYKQFVDKDTLTLKKAGLLSEQLSITDEGAAELLGILFMQHKDALVKIAEEKLKEEKESK